MSSSDPIERPSPPTGGEAAPEAVGRRSLRILHVGPDAEGGGGMSTVIAGLLASPLARGHRLEALATYREPQPLRRLVTFTLALARLVAWCCARGERVVHVHATVRGSMYRKAVCVALAKALRRPVLVQVHAGAIEIEAFARRLGRARAGLLGRVIGLADRVVTVSEAGRAALERSFPLSGVGVVPNAAPAPVISVEPGASRDGVTILYLGGFANPVKGGEVLLEAVRELLTTVPSVRVLLAGPGTPPISATALLEAHPSVRWLGWLDERGKAVAIGQSDIFVLPSTSEGLPMALLEAMANGLAIVATRIGGVPDVVTDDRDGLLVPSGDPRALGRALARLAEDSALRGRLGQEARARAQRLNADEVSGRLEAIYAELAFRGRARGEARVAGPSSEG